MKPKISFLIAAHNEEKIIARTLMNLLNLPYDRYEVLIGLDGCTDGTEEIVKSFARKSKVFKYTKLKSRGGKPEVIDKIEKLAKGEILIIQDADWIFNVRDKATLEDFLSVFDDPKIGGIAESFPVEWSKNMMTANLGYKAVAESHFLWFDFQKKKLTHREKGKRILDSPKMFLTNIFRKNLYKPNSSLGDDFERTKQIMDQGYNVTIFDSLIYPRMIASYNKIGLGDLLKQKTRTAMARKQLKGQGSQGESLMSYYVQSIWHMFKESLKRGLMMNFHVSLWIFITTLGEFLSNFKKLDTKEGWLMRAQR